MSSVYLFTRRAPEAVATVDQIGMEWGMGGGRDVNTTLTVKYAGGIVLVQKYVANVVDCRRCVKPMDFTIVSIRP